MSYQRYFKMRHSPSLWLYITTIIITVKARKSPNAALVERFMDSSANWLTYNLKVAVDGILDVPTLIKKYNYPIEIHKVVTNDGYILEAHRICRDTEKPTLKPPVLLMHGLLGSSADFIIMGPNNSLGYLLADAGHDVWLLNARGNYYSRDHSSLSPKDADFWKFSWDEIGYFDLSAYVDYILAITDHRRVHYIGHSQGGTTFLVLIALKPIYNAKFISFHGLAPAVLFTNNQDPVIRKLADFEGILEMTATAMGLTEVFGKSGPQSWFLENLCFNVSIMQELCDKFIKRLADSKYWNSTMVPVILGHVPAGASLRQLAHFAQVIKYNKFQRYSYNLFTNLRIYGRTNPPPYDLAEVRVPSYIYYGLGDQLVDNRDVINLTKLLPNVALLFKVVRDTFNHLDFLWGTDAPQQVYGAIIKHIDDAKEVSVKF